MNIFNRIKRIFAITAFLIAASVTAALPAKASVSSVYIAQNQLGANTGADCLNAHPASFFNTAINWGTGTSQIGPGTTVHLCGTITTQLSVQSSGSNGLPITVLFEPNAKISLPACDNNNGCLSVTGKSYVVIDGGGTGIIEDTNNGTNLGLHVKSIGIEASNASNLEVKNLTIRNIYVHVPNEVPNLDNPDGCIYWNGSQSNVLIHDNVMHDARFCLNFHTSGSSNIQFYRNDIYNSDHCFANATESGTNTGISFYSNHCHDAANWDTGGADAFHHDGVHAYLNSGTSNGFAVYDNIFDGAWGTNVTAQIYIEQDQTNALVYNNIINVPSSPGNNFGMIGVGKNTGMIVANNTMIGNNTNDFRCILQDTSGANTLFKNNIMSGCYVGFYFVVSEPNVTTDFNLYANVGSCGVGMNSTGNCSNTIAAWRTQTGKEANSKQATTAGLSSSFVPQSGSAAIASAQNLTSLGIATLNSDASGVARGSSWDTGALQSSGSIIPPPSSISITTLSIPNGTVGSPYSTTLAITGGVAPFTWNISGLPSGLTSSSGVISGTPTLAQISVVLASVSDSSSPIQTVSKSFSLTVNAVTPPPVTPTITITDSPTSLSFSANTGSTLPCQTVTIDDNGVGPLPLTLSVAQPWITVTPVSGATKLVATVCVNTTGLSAGVFNGSFAITSAANPSGNTAINSPLSVSVKLTLTTVVPPAIIVTCSVTSSNTNSETLKVVITNFTKGQTVTPSCPSVTHP